MKVSVLVPVYNLGRFIEPCLLRKVRISHMAREHLMVTH